MPKKEAEVAANSARVVVVVIGSVNVRGYAEIVRSNRKSTIFSGLLRWRKGMVRS